jgi:hypothetical protein
MNKILKTETRRFKECTSCAESWKSREEYLEDPLIEIIGYQANFKHLELGLFLFNHHTCQSTLAVPAGEFRDLYDGPVYSAQLSRSDECLDYCMNKDELRPCPLQCECAYVREIIQTVKQWKSL